MIRTSNFFYFLKPVGFGGFHGERLFRITKFSKSLTGYVSLTLVMFGEVWLSAAAQRGINGAEHLDDHQPSTINHQPNSECVPQGNPPAYARPGKASQDNARSQEKFIRKP